LKDKVAARLERSSFSEKMDGKGDGFFRKKREWKADKAAQIKI
jgi:hypothetical protein